MGLVGGSMMLGVALGAPLGGVVARLGTETPLELGSALLLAAALLAAVAARGGDRTDVRAGASEILRAVRSRPEIAVPLAFAFADRFTVGFFTTTFSLYLRRIHDVTALEIGLLIATFMLPFALLSYPFGRLADRHSLVALLCIGSLAYGLGTAAVGFTGPPLLWGLMFAIGITAAVMFVPSMMLTIQLAPESLRATALGAFNAAGSLGFILGPLAGGAISQLVASQTDWATGYRAAFVAAGASEALCVAVTLPFLLRLKRTGRVR
jgi:MFS family permease